MANNQDTLLSKSARYAKMFDIEAETANNGVDFSRDYTDAIDRLRGESPVHKGSLRELLGVPEQETILGAPRQTYCFLSYRACEIGFRENLIFSSEGYNESPGVRALSPVILSMVGKPHKRLRAAAQPLFSRPQARDWWNRRWIEDAVDTQLDRLLGVDAVDLNTELCARLPMAVVTRAIGIEGADALEFRYHLNRSTFGAQGLPPEESAMSREIVDKTLRDLIAENTRNPGDNVIAGLIEGRIGEADGSRRELTEGELFGYCKLMLIAGGGTTWRQFGITIDALLTHYHFWEMCREDRNLIEQAVEESLRWRPTDLMMPRLCTQDAEVDGVSIPAGSRVFLCLAAANHDPALFDRPREFDIFRDARPNMGFGFGPHRCLGMEVARQLMIVAIKGLMDRWPAMKLDSDKPKPLFYGLEHRGMSAVTVKLER